VLVAYEVLAELPQLYCSLMYLGTKRDSMDVVCTHITNTDVRDMKRRIQASVFECQ